MSRLHWPVWTVGSSNMITIEWRFMGLADLPRGPQTRSLIGYK